MSTLRSKEEYLDDIAILRQGSQVATQHNSRGFKSETVWNQLMHFHVMDAGSIAPCTSHDVFNGCGRKDVSLILQSLCEQKFFEWSELQDFFKRARKWLRWEDSKNWFSKLAPKASFQQIPGNHSANHSVI